MGYPGNGSLSDGGRVPGGRFAPEFRRGCGASRPGFPTPVGVLRAVDAPIYEDSVNDQVKQIIAK